MPITPTLNLYYDPTYNPVLYWMKVNLPSGSQLEFNGHETIPSGPYENETLHIEVNVQDLDQGNDYIVIDIGQSPDIPDEEEGIIHVHLLDETRSEVGGNTAGMQQAQEQTKPIPPIG